MHLKKQSVISVSKYMEVAYAYQDLDDLPEGYSVPEGRGAMGEPAMQFLQQEISLMHHLL